MREDVVTPVTARRLVAEGMVWEPQVGDWCTVLGAEHISEAPVGLWLVVGVYAAVGAPEQSSTLGLADAQGRWPVAQVQTRDCLWLPTAGKLKTWLRARGYRVATGERPVLLFGASVQTVRHVCRLTRERETRPVDGEGTNEAEAVADAALKVLGTQTADSARTAW